MPSNHVTARGGAFTTSNEWGRYMGKYLDRAANWLGGPLKTKRQEVVWLDQLYP